MVQFTGADPALGSVIAYEGMGVYCDKVDWAQAMARPTKAGARFFLTQVNPQVFGDDVVTTTTGRYVISLRADVAGTAVAAVQVCYQPNGETYLRVPAAGPAVPMTRQTQTVTLTIARRLDGALRGTTRQILLGPGEQPWVN
jgi:hypothetical protein